MNSLFRIPPGNEAAAKTRPKILLLLGDTIDRKRRTGIHRVVVETARALSTLTDLDLVRWDLSEGRLRYLEGSELDTLFGRGNWPETLKLKPECRSVGRPFRELLEDPANTWLLNPEIWHEHFGVDMLARAVSHCRDWGGHFASIFYDLIPLINPLYSAGAQSHEAYLAELVRTDLVIPISRYAGDTLEGLWRGRDLPRLPQISPLLLPDSGFVPADRPRALKDKRSKRIVMIGTVEPRKRQVQFIQAVEQARRRSRAVAEWEVVVIGTLHPHVAKAFNVQLEAHGWLTHLDYVDDAKLEAVLQDCGFSAFVSDDEGYGLPIAESVALGTPCLCADFGSMAEIAEGGGCFTVDVRDQAALEQAVVQLCETPSILAGLRDELAHRRFRGWTDYAQGILDLIAAAHARAEAEELAPLSVEQAPVLRPGETLDRATLAKLAAADIVRLPDEDSRRAFIAEARRQEWPALLPTQLVVGESEDQQGRLGVERRTRRELALIEQAFARNRAAIDPAFKTRHVFLRILISTFNRREFVVKNARWLLDTVMTADPSIEVMIVDGGSEDQTIEGLLGLGDGRLRLAESSANAGMLGGIRDAARTPGAEYVWVVGDDDFLIADQVLEIVAALKANRGLSFAFTNFSVYHRQALGRLDTPARLIAEALPVATTTAPSGLMKVRQAAEQTDNLFTAIYSIVWRADLLSAAFEHGFKGEPFANLTEAIPCTEFVLKRYADCDAYWHDRTAIAGNAHNNWRRHRPRWHGAVMPMAFALAREAGIDPKLLQSWADLHMTLLQEALELAEADGHDPCLRAEDDPLAEAVFRRALPTITHS